MMLGHYFPPGILGLGLTALMASFMSGMAGNVTAFNTVWTYDIYQSYINRQASDQHYLWMGRMSTVFGIGISMAAAYLATRFNNIMDLLQLVFAFVNAPLFATFLLGMFWKRATGHGAFFGLLSGTIGRRHPPRPHALPKGADVGIKGGWLGQRSTRYPSEMAQNFWTAIWAWTACFAFTILISLATRKIKTDEDLTGLVYSLTPKPHDDAAAWYARPAGMGAVVLASRRRPERHLLVGGTHGPRHPDPHRPHVHDHRSPSGAVRPRLRSVAVRAFPGDQRQPLLGCGPDGLRPLDARIGPPRLRTAVGALSAFRSIAGAALSGEPPGGSLQGRTAWTRASLSIAGSCRS